MWLLKRILPLRKQQGTTGKGEGVMNIFLKISIINLTNSTIIYNFVQMVLGEGCYEINNKYMLV